MIKRLLLLSRYILTVFISQFIAKNAAAQTDADALMIPKNYYCAAASYVHSDWSRYWEGTYKRDNPNLGTVTTQTVNFIGNYGITNKLDVLFTLPYVFTNATGGYLKGQHGLQDLSLTLKYLAFQDEIGKGIISIHAIAQGTLPLSNYQPDFLPLSIGLHSRTASLRALVNYQTGRFFAAAAGQYVLRDDVTLDRNSYYTTRLIYSNKVDIPNATNILVSAGYRSLKLNVEGIVTQYTTQGGFDIRKNDNPFPSNRMNMTTAGGLAKYSLDGLTGLELTAGGNYVIRGRNVGQSTTFFAGVLYVFEVSKR